VERIGLVVGAQDGAALGQDADHRIAASSDRARPVEQSKESRARCP
jgi:hypothetical protein